MELFLILKSLGVGLAVGIIFSLFKLPIPAPPVLSGIMGIVGIYLGGVLYPTLITFLQTLFRGI